MTPAELATLSLLDPDQGVCPAGHACVAGDQVGDRSCRTCNYRGLALICWDITSSAIDSAERGGAHPRVVAWARSFMEASNE